MISAALILIAFVLALLEAIQFKAQAQGRIHWGWLAITFWFASLLVGVRFF